VFVCFFSPRVHVVVMSSFDNATTDARDDRTVLRVRVGGCRDPLRCRVEDRKRIAPSSLVGELQCDVEETIMVNRRGEASEGTQTNFGVTTAVSGRRLWW
jgi:hypothetical protein